MMGAKAGAFVQSLIGKPAFQRSVARDAVTASAIRSWCDAMGERNPVYLDPDAAREAGYLDVIAPPAMLQVWTMPGLEPGRPYTAGPSRDGDLDESVRATLGQLGYSGTLAGSIEQGFAAALVVGDRVIADAEYIAASEEKQTHLGPGFFLTHRRTYSTADGTKVGTLTASVFHFAPRPADGVAPPLAPPSTPPERAAPGTPVRIEQGAECGPLLVPVTPTQVMSGAAATRDFYPVHHDRDFARAHGNADFLMNILTTNGLLARIVGEWTSQAPLLRLSTRLVAPAYVHDELTVSGQVTDVSPETADITVRAALRSGVHAEAVARVTREN
jgi:acyl dehydratase